MTPKRAPAGSRLHNRVVSCRICKVTQPGSRALAFGAKICSHHASLALGAQDLVRGCPPRTRLRTSLLTRNDWAGRPAWPGRSNAAARRRRAAMRGAGGRGLRAAAGRPDTHLVGPPRRRCASESAGAGHSRGEPDQAVLPGARLRGAAEQVRTAPAASRAVEPEIPSHAVRRFLRRGQRERLQPDARPRICVGHRQWRT